MDDKNLIFLISQPRSGSSMLQQILVQNKKIKSFPEPWLMLPLVYIYKYPKSNIGYNPNYANINLLEYMNNFSEGTDFLKGKIKQCAFDLYELVGLEKGEFFLDKTPRYYHIINELLDLFPRAKFIFLIRNPISVFSSILAHNFQGNLNKFLKSDDRLDDLYVAPKNILDIKKSTLKNTCFLKYEDIVLFPDNIIKILSEFMGFKFESVNYRVNDAFVGSERIDTKSVCKHNKPVDNYLDSWKKNINTYSAKTELLKYINNLGPKTIEGLGYDYKKIIKDIKHHKVNLWPLFTGSN